MFNIEVRFKVGGREVPPERFVAQFFRECLGEALNEAMIGLESLPRPAQPLAPVAPVTIPKPERRVVSVREAAQLLGVSPATIRAWTGRRSIPFVHLGRRAFIPVEAIDDLLFRGLVPAKEHREERLGTTRVRSWRPADALLNAPETRREAIRNTELNTAGHGQGLAFNTPPWALPSAGALSPAGATVVLFVLRFGAETCGMLRESSSRNSRKRSGFRGATH
jgi:excisionase family DNA binding protein